MPRENGLLLQELQDSFLALITRVSGFSPDRVFWADSSSDVPVPPRPYIALVFRPPESPLRAADDRNFNAQPYWRLEVLQADVGVDYEVDIVGNTYAHTATGFDTEFTIRDALVTAAAADPNATVTATGTVTASIDIQGDTTGVNLPVSIRPDAAHISAIQYRGARVATISRPITCVIEVSVWARLPKGVPDTLDIPSATDTSVHHLTRILGGLLHRDATAPMRALGHIPKLVTSMPDLSSVLRDEGENVTRLDVEVETTLCHTEFGEWTTVMSVINASPQLP